MGRIERLDPKELWVGADLVDTAFKMLREAWGKDPTIYEDEEYPGMFIVRIDADS